MAKSDYWEIIEKLTPLGYRKIREIEHDIIDRQLFQPDLPIMPYICERHKISPERYIVISEDVREHLCSNTIFKNIPYGGYEDETD